ncbi:TraR/DksA C4-type zinc finger protein [Pseudomonas aeruginosa]|uniref:TraR/DksA C4-type zinc finger protein n=1 Tax=Pseudomonas aeruginosa TaxID=287 RepID=UPI000710B47F|nr:TraR/DksA C4-type zinc finger protein [Pseudomonas aeruginosa]
MADNLDLAAEREEIERASLIASRQRPALAHTISATHCEDCGDEIPAARRLAVPGCECCIDCQQLREVRR